MGVCKDPSVKHLAKFGYNVIMHPREGILPLMLIGERNGARDIIGTLDQLIAGPTVELPKMVSGGDAASISGKKSDKLELSLGLDILGAIIGALGGSKLGLTAGYNQARSVEFIYEGVASDGVNVMAVGDYMASGTPRFDHPILTQYLEDPGNLYVITEVVHSNQVGVNAYSKKGVSLAVDVPVISAAVGGNIKVGGEGEGTGRVDYKGDRHLAFGFKAFEISALKQKNGARKLRIAPVKAGAIVFRSVNQKLAKHNVSPAMFPSIVIDLETRKMP